MIQMSVSVSWPAISKFTKPNTSHHNARLWCFISHRKWPHQKLAVNMLRHSLRFTNIHWWVSQATSKNLSWYTHSQHFIISDVDKVMTFTVLLNAQLLKEILNRDDFFYLKDPAKSLQADNFVKKQFLITTVERVDFCKTYTFDDSVSEHHSLLLLLI